MDEPHFATVNRDSAPTHMTQQNRGLLDPYIEIWEVGRRTISLAVA